jgi:hypothetical protein
MPHATWIVCLAVALVSFSYGADAQSNASWDIVLNGRAVHMNATHEWNEDNWGIGIEREFAATGPWVRVALANGFSDSMGNPSYMAGGGIKRRFRMGRSEDFYVDLGGIAFLMTREHVNGDRPFPGVLPAATFGFKRVALNMTYLPEAIADRVTHSRTYDPTMHGVFFLQLKLDASLFGLGNRNGPFFARNTAD